MSYQSAYFNRKQQAIRAMSDIAAGHTENTVAADSQATVFPIRYAKDLMVQTADSLQDDVKQASMAEAAHTSNHVTQGVSELVEPKLAASEAVAVNEAEEVVLEKASDNTAAAQTEANTDQPAASSEKYQTYTANQSLNANVSKDERGLALVMWLGSLVFLMIPAMIVLLNGNASDYLKQQAREALNWTSTFLLGSVACTILMLIFIGGPLQVLLSIAHVIFCLLGANAARSGSTYRVPMAWRPLD
ncbi:MULTISPECIES: DUF4870 domain-containing protein [Vitreoscilla]|uniref:DUF4870 domain-containing protein n=1 Tax=Vitreoscilla stercoraria TaxID=61 RepID=A0ABY4EG61_VITST|nr:MULTISPECIES: DUF4870 domain-containing protein [Vitreoscilla]AUZ06261.1 hypothetical protein ADP71_30720 [Vitreoscilla sp. C1]UOO92382.1 DUF4870 domain-containing protein [Vitreoscilla stercoraria]